MGRIVNSFQREIGKNAGKAVSNFLFGDMHATPYRRVGSSNRAPKERVVHVYHETKAKEPSEPSGPSIDEILKIQLEEKRLGQISDLAGLQIPKDRDGLYDVLSRLATLMSAHKWKSSGGIENKYNEALLEKCIHCIMALKATGEESPQLDYFCRLANRYKKKRFYIKNLHTIIFVSIIIIALLALLFSYLAVKEMLTPVLTGLAILVIIGIGVFAYIKIGGAKEKKASSAEQVPESQVQETVIKQTKTESIVPEPADNETDFIDLNYDGRIEKRLTEIWNRYKNSVPIDIINRKPIFSADGVKDSILFVGVNPSYDANDDSVLIQSDKKTSLLYGSFYKLDTAPDYFKKLEQFAAECGKGYTHINLLYARENDRDALLNSNSEFIREQLELTYDTILKIKPAAIIIFSTYCRTLIFGKERWLVPDTLLDGHFTLNGTNYPVFLENDITVISPDERNRIIKLVKMAIN